MTDSAYDPELPYAVVRLKDAPDFGFKAGIEARFAYQEDAEEWLNCYGAGVAEVIDTTPKPKIPADAEFIYWRDGFDQPMFARKMEDGRWEDDEGYEFGEVFLISEYIKDAEVTVLEVRK